MIKYNILLLYFKHKGVLLKPQLTVLKLAHFFIKLDINFYNNSIRNSRLVILSFANIPELRFTRHTVRIIYRFWLIFLMFLTKFCLSYNQHTDFNQTENFQPFQDFLYFQLRAVERNFSSR